MTNIHRKTNKCTSVASDKAKKEEKPANEYAYPMSQTNSPDDDSGAGTRSKKRKRNSENTGANVKPESEPQENKAQVGYSDLITKFSTYYQVSSFIKVQYTHCKPEAFSFYS